MFKLKKLIAILTAALLIISLAACKGSDAGSKSSGSISSKSKKSEGSSNTSAVSEASNEGSGSTSKSNSSTKKSGSTVSTKSTGGSKGSAEALPEDKYTKNGKTNPYKNLNLKGASIRIGATWSPKPGADGSSTYHTLLWKRIRHLESTYNCKIEYMTLNGSEMPERIRSSVAAQNPYADFLILYTAQLPSYALNGYLQNVDEMKCIDIKDPKWISGCVQMGTLNNKHYGFAISYYPPRYVVAFNKDMFKKNGWEDPYALYKSGKWTWNKLIEIAKKATNASAGRYGFTGASILGASIVASFGGAIVSLDSKGIPKFTGDSNNCAQAYQLLGDLTNKHNIMWTPSSTTWEVYAKALADGTVAMTTTQLYLIREHLLEMEDDYGLVPIPKADNAQGRYASVADNVPVTVMLGNNPLAQEKAYILDLLTEPFPGNEDLGMITELESYCRDSDSVNIMLDLEKKYITFDYSIWFSKARSDYSAAISSVLNGSATFAEAMGKAKGSIEKSVSDVYASWQE